MLGFRGSLPLLFFLLVALSSFPSHISDCQRTCGSTTVPYPFGFSDGCNIALNCSTNHTKIRLGDFQVRNITPDSLLVDVPPACNRHVNAIKSLFGTNYALTRRNGLFLRNCTSDNPSCLVPTRLLSQKDLDSCGDNTTCFSDDGKPDDFLAAKKITSYGCSYLVTSMGIERDANDSLQLPVVLQTAVVEWWLEGQCRCSPLANCTNLTSPVTGKPSFRCKCLEGFHGDGFNDSLGCQKGQSALSLSFALPGETKPPRKKNPLAPIKFNPSPWKKFRSSPLPA